MNPGSTKGRLFLASLRRRWIVVLAAPLIFGVSIYFSERGNQARYRSTATVLLQTTDLGAILAGVPDLSRIDPYRAVATETIVASVPQVRDRAIAALGATGTDEAKTADIAFHAPESFSQGDADVLDMTVTANSRAFAQGLATEVARQYIAFRAEVANSEVQKTLDQVHARQRQIANDPNAETERNALVNRAEKLETLLLLGNDRARLISPGDEAAQIAPKPEQRAIVAGVLGLLLGAVLALVIDRLDKSVRSEEEIAERLDAPIIAKLPDPRRLGQAASVIALSQPRSAETEAFRLLRANLRFSLLARRGHSVAVTSTREAEGKTFVACNLAVVAAAAGAKVILVDLDLRRPRVHQAFGLERYPGVPEVLTGSTRLVDATATVDVARDYGQLEGARGSLSVLCAGAQLPNPGEVTASMALRSLLSDLEEQYELVVIDTPPVSVVSDAIPIASIVSGTIAVVRAPEARRPDLDALNTALQSSGGSMGVALTAAWRAPSSYYTYNTQAPDPEPPDAGRAGRTSSALFE